MKLPDTRRFPIRFDRWYRWMSIALFIAPSDSWVEIEGDRVNVRMAWAFRARFALGAVGSASLLREKPVSRGVHGFRGRWLVNGSGDGIVAIDLDAVESATVLGIPVELRQLLVSVDEPDVLVDALHHAVTGPSAHAIFVSSSNVA